MVIVQSHPWISLVSSLKALVEMPVQEGREDALHRLLAERVDGDDVEVAQEAGSDGVPTPSRGTHGWHKHDVLQVKHTGVFPEMRSTRIFNYNCSDPNLLSFGTYNRCS